MDAKRKEIEARRAAAASKATKTFYKITVKVHVALNARQASCTAVRHGKRGGLARLAVLHVQVLQTKCCPPRGDICLLETFALCQQTGIVHWY